MGEWKLVGGVLQWVGGGTPAPKPTTTTTSSSSGGSGGGSGSSGAYKPLTADQTAQITRDLKRAYNTLFPAPSNRAVPPNMLKTALKERWADAGSAGRWLLDARSPIWEKTLRARSRANTAMQNLDSIFGENKKIKAAFVKSFVWGDPTTMTWDRFLDVKVVKSKAFAAAYPGFGTWYKQQSGMDYSKAIQQFNGIKDAMTGWYKDVMGDPMAKVPASIMVAAFKGNISDANSFQSYVRANDPSYATSNGGAGEAKNKGQEFDELWNGIYGDESAPNPLLREAYQRTSPQATIGDFFNNFIRTSEQFKRQEPDFEKWAQAATGSLGGDMHVNPFDFIEKRNKLRDEYKLLTENPDANNEALVSQALTGGWSDERLALEFRLKDKAYETTSTFKDRQNTINTYYKSILGSDAVAPKAVADGFVRGATNDVTSMFDTIKQTAEFQTQYGNWAEFQKAQDYAGNTSQVLRDPQTYKAYVNTFAQAFANVGLTPPPEFEKMMFHSGVDPDSLKPAMQDWVQTKDAYQIQTGKTPDMATAIGIGDKAAGGDLGLKMREALEAHKAYTTSKYAGIRANETQGSNLITQQI